MASSSCHWNSGDDAICDPPSTTIVPGCCYGNPDAAYSKRWMDTCTGYYTERECLFNVDADGNYRCHWEELVDDYDCSQLWPTTTSTPTIPPGCCYGDSYKANDKCLKATEQDKCEDKGCNWLVTDDPEDCEMTTTTTTSTTPSPTEGGCCDSDVSQKKFDKCILKLTESQCERMSECFWNAGYDAVCEPPVFTTTPSPTDPAGCCRGSSYKANDKCLRATSEDKCELQGCEWLVTEDPEDCVVTTTTTETPPTTTTEEGCCGSNVSQKKYDNCNAKETRDKCERMSDCYWESGSEAECPPPVFTTTTSTPEVGCCAGETVKSNEMCNGKTDSESCGRSGKCQWREGEDADCELTTTSEPWMGAKPAAKARSKSVAHHQQEAMLFGGESVIAETMQTTVTLSTVLLCVMAAFATYQLYRWWAARASKLEYTPLD